MRKGITLFLVVVMVVCLAGCGTEKTGGKAPDKGNFKVGAIYIANREETAGYTFAHHSGIVTAMESLNMDAEAQLFIVDEIPEKKEQVLEAVEELISEGVHIIFGISFGYMDALEEAAAKYPDVIFSHATGYRSNEANFNN